MVFGKYSEKRRNDVYMMNNEGITAKIERICQNHDETHEDSSLVLYLDVADYINAQYGRGDVARNVIFTIAKLLSNNNNIPNVIRTKLNVLKLLDVLVKNCGYPIHLHMSRKGFLQVLAGQFPSRQKGTNSPDSTVQLELLMEINMWYHTLCQWVSYKNELVYIKNLYNLIIDRGYQFPPVDVEEIQMLKAGFSKGVRTFEEFNHDQEIILNSQITEFKRRGGERDMQLADSLVKRLRYFKTNRVTVEAQRDIMNHVSKWTKRIDEWDNKLDINLLQADEEEDHIDIMKLSSFIRSLQAVQQKIQTILLESSDDEQFINNLLLFNDIVVRLLDKFKSHEDSMHDDNDQINKIVGEDSDEEEELQKTFDNGVEEQEPEDVEIKTEQREPQEEEMDSSQKCKRHVVSDASLDGTGQEKMGSETHTERSEKNEELKDDLKHSVVLPEIIPDEPPRIEHQEEYLGKQREHEQEELLGHEGVEQEKKSNESEQDGQTIKDKEGGKLANDMAKVAVDDNVLLRKEKWVEVETTKNSIYNSRSSSFLNPVSILQSSRKSSVSTIRSTGGFMFAPKIKQSSPVTTFAVSKAESSGQFKFDGNSNEITTNFKPFLDNPEN